MVRTLEFETPEILEQLKKEAHLDECAKDGHKPCEFCKDTEASEAKKED